MPKKSNTPAPPPADVQLLDDARTAITGPRREAYGDPEDNFRTIAALWMWYLNAADHNEHGGATVCIAAHDVANMLILMKIARLAQSPNHYDSAVDIAGYAACLARCQKPTVPRE